LSWSGDTPGLTKLMGLTGHNSYKGCRYCNIKGVYSNHIYYPTTNYDVNDLPLRFHDEYKKNILDIEHATTQKETVALRQNYGK
jgi:hypothetical protein